jgi:plasmid stability protein
MKNLTIRNVPNAVADALEEEKRRRGRSLNQTVLELLSQGLGVGTTRSNGLGRLAGSWTEEEFREFEAAVARFESIDDELWR